MINQIKAGIVLSYVNMALTSILRLIYTPILLSHLGISGYGIYSLALSVIGYLTVFDFGFSNALIHHTAEIQVKDKNGITEKELIGLFFLLYLFIGLLVVIAGIIFAVFAHSIYGQRLTESELTIFRVVILIMAINLAFTFPLSVYKAIITSYERFVFQRISTLIYIVVNVSVMMLILFCGGYVIALSIAATIVNLCLQFSEYLYCKIALKTKIKINLKYLYLLKEIFSYSGFVFLGSIGNQAYKNGSQMLLGATVGPAGVALYSLALQIESLFISFSLTFTSVFLPKLTKKSAQKGDKDISDIFLKVGRIQYIILLWIFCGIVILGKPFILIWGGDEYEQSYYILIVLLFPLLFSKSQNLGKVIMQAKNTMKVPYLVSFFVAPIVALLCSIFTSMRYGVIGCAITCSSVMFLAEIIFLNYYYYRYHHIDMIQWWKNTWKISALPICISIICFLWFKKWTFNSYMNIFCAAALFSVLYLIVTLFVIDDYEEKQIASFYHLIFRNNNATGTQK